MEIRGDAEKTTINNVTQWTVMSNGAFRICGPTIAHLPAGAYACELDNYSNAVFYQRQLLVDDLVDFPGCLAAQIIEEIERFWTIGERFHKYGFLHHRGYLLYGKQGSGKSSLIHQLIVRAIKQGHIALFCESPLDFTMSVQQLRAVDPNRPLLCIFEDLDAIIGRHGSNVLLQWLDGNCQIDKAVNIATTNFPERLDRRISSRPRRFDRVLRIDPPAARLREAFFERKIPDLFAQERRRWVDLSEGLTFAGLSELIISVCCLDKDLEESIALLKELDRNQAASDEYDGMIDEEDQPEHAWHHTQRKRTRDYSAIPF
jgi:hypothetical protein